MSTRQVSRIPSPRPPVGRRRAAARRNRIIVLDGEGHSIPPLQWWRRLPAPAFTAMHVAVIRRAIRGITIIDEPNWPDAEKGDPAAAAGVARRAIKRRRWPSPGGDLVMSALLRCAIEGSRTAVNLLEFALGRMVVKDPACAVVAASWRTIAHAPRVSQLNGG
jgi:hypothetical protein